MSFHRFMLHLFFSDILSLRYHTNRIWITVRYDGCDNFPGARLLVPWWPGNMMSCLAPLAGGPSIITSFARITILPGGNCKTYFISCSWWIICVSKVWALIEAPYHCYLEARLWYPAHQQEHWRRDAKCFLVSYPNTVVWVTSWLILLPLYLNGWVLALLPCMPGSACPWEGYTPNDCV